CEGVGLDDDVLVSLSDAPRRSKRAATQRGHLGILSSFASSENMERGTFIRGHVFLRRVYSKEEEPATKELGELGVMT
ncbi:hypothetical protein ACLOJK_018704, partial [Asimina triloba]